MLWGIAATLSLALFATFRVILKLLVVKETLLTSRKDELGSAFVAFKHPIDKIHGMAFLRRHPKYVPQEG